MTGCSREDCRGVPSPMVAFFALVYLITWALLPFTRLSIAFSLVALSAGRRLLLT